MGSNWSDPENEPPAMNEIYQCKHSIAVLSSIVFGNKIEDRLDKKSNLVFIDLVHMLSSVMSDRSFQFTPNQWYQPNEINIQYQDGTLAIFQSPTYQILLLHLSFWNIDSNKKRFICFICSRRGSCTHVADVPRRLKEAHPFYAKFPEVSDRLYQKVLMTNDEINSNYTHEFQQPLDETYLDDDDNVSIISQEDAEKHLDSNDIDDHTYIPERDDPRFSQKVSEEGTDNISADEILAVYGSPIFSIRNYPDDVSNSNDLELCMHITDRLQYGVKNWLNTNCEDKIFNFESKECCGKSVDVQPPTSVKIYSLNGFFFDYAVTYGVCSNCRVQHNFDGRSIGLVNFGNNHLFFAEFFYELLQFKLNAGVPTSAWWRSKVNITMMFFPDSELKRLEIKKFMNMAGKINAMMIQFIKLIDYTPKIFQCCQNPEIVCVDGMVLSIRSDRLDSQNLKTPWVHADNSFNQRFTTRPDRSLMSFTKDEKELLRQYRKIGLSNADWISLTRPHLRNPVMKFIISNNIQDSTALPNKCNEMLVKFIHCIYKDLCPAAIIAPTVCWVCLRHIEEKNRIHPKILQELQTLAPLLGSVVLYISIYCQIPEKQRLALEMISFIFAKARDNYEQANTKYRSNIKENQKDQDSSIKTNYFLELRRTGYFFPGRPKLIRFY